jgi:hypothetical protein
MIYGVSNYLLTLHFENIIGGRLMSRKLMFLIFPVVLSASSFAQQEAGDRRPGSNIVDANWEEYKYMYTSSPLCSEEEITLWSCETSGKIYSLCSSTHISRKEGYIQYRVSRNGNIIFTFPNSKTPPFGLFSYHSSSNGDAYINFSNGGYDYNLGDPLRGNSVIFVSSKKSPNHSSEIQCNSGNQTLQVNYTMRLMFDAGIWSNYY